MTNNKVINLTVGWAFILLGIAGAILPVLQGFLFFVVGLLFLSKEYHWAHRLLEWLRVVINKRFPKTGKVFENAEKFLEGEVHKMAHEPGYLKKKIWAIIGVLALLGFSGWVLGELFFWLKGLIFGP